MAPVKAQLKRFLSAQPWSAADDAALADLVGQGSGTWRRDLAPGVVLEHGWRDDRYRVEVLGGAGEGEALDTAWLADTFSGAVVPEATPSARTIRFATGPTGEATSRWYAAAADADDDRAAALFALDGVTNVLVGPDFVAVGLDRPDRWESLLRPVLDAVAEQFAVEGVEPVLSSGPPPWLSGGGDIAPPEPRSASRLDRAWAELGRLHPAEPGDSAVVVEASRSDDAARRQVAANLLGEADPEVALAEWARLVADPSRLVRRATVDALVDAGREPLRPLLERASADDDAWTRWKALRGLAELGVGPSRPVVAERTGDPDFRVRLEATGALRRS